MSSANSSVVGTRDRSEMAQVAERAILGVLHGSAAEPPATRGRGPAAFLATSTWLRSAYSDLTWTTEEHAVHGDLVVTFGRMSGRHTGNFVV